MHLAFCFGTHAKGVTPSALFIGATRELIKTHIFDIREDSVVPYSRYIGIPLYTLVIAITDCDNTDRSIQRSLQRLVSFDEVLDLAAGVF